ncbi:MAG: Holliday junction branch migration protein RuvA [Caldilineae bacterium]|nr:MAG: Holliday junction branch migration protein RuvA [Caldilineae bacterium]
MISRIRGRVEHIAEDFVVIDVGAVSINVAMPSTQLATLRVGQAVVLHTHLHVREQALALFGFLTAEELQLFELLIEVSGVGPRLALNILSTLTPETLRRAVAGEEPALLARVPGIGNKSARKILFHLKDKLAGGEPGEFGAGIISDADTEVIEALTSLGYSVVEAQRALQGIPDDVTDVEERLRLALAQMSP